MNLTKTALAVGAFLAGTFLFCGCEDSGGGGGGGGDVGDNDPSLIICVGDSITEGVEGRAPYPPLLAAMVGKTTINMGSGGATTAYGASRISSQLSRKPGYVCILYGANDAIQGLSTAAAKQNLRKIVTACKNAKSIPILATTPPMIKGHDIFNGHAEDINAAIRELAAEEGVRCVDVNRAFDSGEGYLVADGLHPNAAGADLIARSFAGAF